MTILHWPTFPLSMSLQRGNVEGEKGTQRCGILAVLLRYHRQEDIRVSGFSQAGLPCQWLPSTISMSSPNIPSDVVW